MKKIIVLALISLIFILIFVSQFIIKVRIECKSQFGECPGQINSLLSALNYKSMFRAKNETGKILKGNFLITDYSTQYKIPDILLVNILIRKPEFSLFNKNSSELWLVDGDGTVLTKSVDSTLPKVITDQNIPAEGKKVDDATLDALNIIRGVWEMYQVGSGEMEGGSMVIDLPAKIQVIFPLDTDPQLELGALRLVYSKVTTGDLAGKYQQIDLRFKNPVLR